MAFMRIVKVPRQKPAEEKRPPGKQGRKSRPAFMSMSTATWTVLAVLFLAAIVLDAFFSDTGILKVWQLDQECRQEQAEVEAVRLDNARLRGQIEALEASPAAVEKLAREEMYMARPGEDVYLFTEEPKREDFLPPKQEQAQKP